jgi:hypothetical protein
MSSNSQIENMVGTWSDLQQQLWRGWLGTLQLTPSGWWKQNYRIPLEICEEMVKLGLQAQSQYAQICMKGLQPNKAMPEFVNQVGERMQMMTENWTEAQRQAWETWFKAAKQLDPTHPSMEWEVPAQNLFQSWQEAAEKTLEMQANLVSLVATEQQPAAAAESEEKTLPKKAAAAPKKVA